MTFSKTLIASSILATTLFTSQAFALSSDKEKLSYTIGIQLGQTLKSQGLDLDSKSLNSAITDVLNNKKLQMTPPEMQAQLEKERARQLDIKKTEGAAQTAKGQAFLAKNKTKPNVVSQENGLQYIIEKAGKGDSPKPGSTVTVHYRGSLIDGSEFDSSYSRGKPTSFGVDNVIPGFKEALLKMKPGAKWKVFIPSDLGYGERGAGPKIGPNEVLIFDIELIESK